MNFSTTVTTTLQRKFINQTPNPAATNATVQAAPKDRPFNGFRMAATSKAKLVVEEMTRLLLNYEGRRAPRKRARKQRDKVTFQRQVEALVCDLIHRHLTRPGTWLSLSLNDANLGRKDRYRPQATTKKLKEVLVFMVTPEMEMAERLMGFHNPFNANASRQTTIRVGARLIAQIEKFRLTLDDFELDKSHELIILKDAKEDRWDKGKWLQYTDTEETIRYRDELSRINQILEEADIDYVDHYQGTHGVDTSNRCLRRYFNNNSFEEGGRLFGGFWQHLSKKQRHNIQIDGMRTVTLDYGQMVPRLLYGLAGHEMGFEDAYTIPGLEGYREGVKMVLNSMLHSEVPLMKKPQGSADLLPKTMSIHDITDLITKFHEPIAHMFYTGKGLYLTFKESTILMHVLTGLREVGIVALPIHDAIMIREDQQAKATEVMLRAFRTVAGTEGLVKVEY